MRISITVVSAVLTIAAAPVPTETPAPLQPASAPKPASTCEVLARDWKSVEFDLAESYADGITDDSAPRATMRAARNTESMLRAQTTLTLMHDYKCALPKRAPSQMTYSLSAIKCATEKLKGNYKAPECDYSTWTPIGR